MTLRSLLITCVAAGMACAQPGPSSGSPAASEKAQVAADPLGRTTPRGTVLGFLVAIRKNQDQAPVQYLNTRLQGQAASDLAQQLSVVLNLGLPAKLNELSERPEGSRALVNPDEELVGTISVNGQKVDITVERVDRAKIGPIWLFSRRTLAEVPALFEEFNVTSIEAVLPSFLVNFRIGYIPLFEILAFAALILLYWLATLLNRRCSPLAGELRRRVRKQPGLPDPDLIPGPVRLIVLGFVIRWALSRFAFPLLARQFWSGVATMTTIAACTWAFILVTGWAEGRIRTHLTYHNRAGFPSILHFGRRTVDILAVFVGLLFAFSYLGVNPTAALAGLGVGGIAVALAAQKTLENVIGGVSLILDRPLVSGDLLKVGNVMGFVEGIGLRSTRLRTFERTVVSVPNGHLANIQLENFSAREKLWFHHILSVRYETTAAMMRSIIQNIGELLKQHESIDKNSVRVNFLRLGTSSLDIELFAYVLTSNFVDFLEKQEDLLLRIMEIVQTAGARLAVPAQTMYMAQDQPPEGMQKDPGSAVATDGKPDITVVRRAGERTKLNNSP